MLPCCLALAHRSLPLPSSKANGWPRHVAKSGIQFLNDWPFDIAANESVYFTYYPDAPQGDLYRYHYGRLRVELPDGRDRYLDIGNPHIDFDGYDTYLPPNVFTFTDDVFVNASSDLHGYPLHEGEEMLLVNGSDDPICDGEWDTSLLFS